jgi:hypothetical protein
MVEAKVKVTGKTVRVLEKVCCVVLRMIVFVVLKEDDIDENRVNGDREEVKDSEKDDCGGVKDVKELVVVTIKLPSIGMRTTSLSGVIAKKPLKAISTRVPSLNSIVFS